VSHQLLDILSPADHEQAAKIHGVMIGEVTDNRDPDNMGRVKVHLHCLEVESTWAYIATPMAGAGRGVYFLPEVHDVVLVVFVHGNTDCAYIVGSVWQGNNAPPENNSDGENNIRVIRSRSGNVFRFSDKDGDERIEIIDKTGGNSVVIKASDNSVAITCKGRMTLQADGIEITSNSDIKIHAGTTMNVDSSEDMTIQGAQVNIN
jgi:uncharacterized protein involved in type VI secretion and phage assembly